MITNDNMEIEKQRLTSLLFDCGVSENRIKLLSTVIENTAWMKAKLDDAREQIKNTSVVIPYDNGGGQKGIRENPLFKGYESLWKSYMTGMCRLLDYVPKQVIDEEAEKIDTPRTVLELVRNKHRKEA